MSVLTRDEAQTRAQFLDVERYTIALDLTTGDQTFDSRTAIRFTATRPETPSSRSSPPLRSISLDGQPLDPALLDGNRYPSPASPPAPTNCASTPRCTTPAPARACTASPTPPTARPTSTPSSSWRTSSASSPPSTSPTSNRSSPSTSPPRRLDRPRQRRRRTHRHGTVDHRPTPLISTYLVAVAAGPWHSVTTEHAGLPFGIHCRRSLAPHLDADADEILDITRACYDRYHEKFDEPYPFDSYDQAFVPEFNAGAMENPGLVTFRDEFVFRSAVTDTERQTRAMVIAHEMAHMWFGDLVTLAWWDDIWLNESFAEYMGYQTLTKPPGPAPPTPPAPGNPSSPTPGSTSASPARAGATTPTNALHPPRRPRPRRRPRHRLRPPQLRRHQLRQGRLRPAPTRRLARREGLPGRHQRPLRPPQVRQRHPRRLHRQPRLRHRPRRPRLGRAVAPHHRRRHLTAEVTTPDAPPPTAPASPGPSPSPATAPAPPHRRRRLRPRPGHPGRPRPPRPARPLRDRRTRRRHPTVRPAPAPPSSSSTTATSPTPRSARTPTPGTPSSPASPASPTPSPAPSSGTPPATWSATATWTPPPTSRPPAPTSRTRATSPSSKASSPSPPGRSPTATPPPGPARRPRHPRRPLPRPHPPHRGRLPPGLRLIAVRHFIDAATQPDTLRNWLDEGTVHGGPELDPELRWRILTRLAALGATDETAIAAALEADPSATGREGAARCRAALPPPRPRRRWDALFNDDTLSNYLFAATAQGFWQPGQEELLAAYVPRFYPDAIALAARRGPAIAEAAGRYAFPPMPSTPKASPPAPAPWRTPPSSPPCAASSSTSSTTSAAPRRTDDRHG